MSSPSANTLRRQYSKILEHFMEQCAKYEIEVPDKDYAIFLLHMLMRDARMGLNLQDFRACTLDHFIGDAVQLFADPLHPTNCSAKLCFFFKNCEERKFEFVQNKYNKIFKGKLEDLIKYIMKYPETSNLEQIDKLTLRIQVFILTQYSLGSPKNHVLMKLARKSLQSVISVADLQDYVLKKTYNRLEYLERLSATVSGIIIYNNHGHCGEKEAMRDLFADLNMAQQNTLESIESSLKRCTALKDCGISAIENMIRIDTKQKVIECLWPLQRIWDINRFVVLFALYDRCLNEIKKSYERIHKLINKSTEKFYCIVEKLSSLLKYRTAVKAELVFPHFVYVSENWLSLLFCFDFLAEINNIKEKLDQCVCQKLEDKFVKLVELMQNKIPNQNYGITPTFSELIEHNNKRKGKVNLLNIHECMSNYCALTLALTNGLLISSNLKKKLCANLEMRFGFYNLNFSRFFEHDFEDFLNLYNNAIFTSTDLLLLSNLEDEIMREDEKDTAPQNDKVNNCGTQTEFLLTNDMSVPNRINVDWNIWNFHRETIRLASLRRKQTNFTQTDRTFGKSNAQNQIFEPIRKSS